MPELTFAIETAEAVPYAASPLLHFKLRISNAVEGEQIDSIALRGQIQIETNRRRYNSGEQEHLLDLFGQPERYSQTLRSMLWTVANVNVPAFVGSTLVNLPVPCTYDFNVAAAKYFYALEGGEVPLTILFSGTIFYETGQDGLQITQVPWEKEAPFRLPVQVWKDLMDIYYPNTAWLCLQRDVFDQLYRYKMQHGLPTWEQAIESLLKERSPV
jgi:Family of unknown function (DUF6084)